MNIFVTDKCPMISAQALDNKRVVKMAIETAQLLSAAIFINSNIIYEDIYKPTHLKHPCTIWASARSGNWDWLFQHFIALCEEYSFRYTKQHASGNIKSSLLSRRVHIKDGAMTTFVNCTKSEAMQIDFKHISEPCEAYKKYLTAKWNHDKLPPKWTNRKPPSWYNTKCNN